MWREEESKMELAASMVRKAMPGLSAQRSVIILCDSWYATKNLLCVVDEYANLDVICNARCDSVIYGLAPQPAGRRGRYGRRPSNESDFALSDERIGDYYIGVRKVLTNLFGQREVLAQVGQTASFAKTISESDVYGFAGPVGDFNSARLNQVEAEKGI